MNVLRHRTGGLRPAAGRGLAAVIALLVLALSVGVASALADAGNPITGTMRADAVDNGDGTVTSTSAASGTGSRTARTATPTGSQPASRSRGATGTTPTTPARSRRRRGPGPQSRSRPRRRRRSPPATTSRSRASLVGPATTAASSLPPARTRRSSTRAPARLRQRRQRRRPRSLQRLQDLERVDQRVPRHLDRERARPARPDGASGRPRQRARGVRRRRNRLPGRPAVLRSQPARHVFGRVLGLARRLRPAPAERDRVEGLEPGAHWQHVRHDSGDDLLRRRAVGLVGL